MAKYKEPNIDVEILKNRKDVSKYMSYYVTEDGEIYNKHGHKMQPYKSLSGSWVIMLRSSKGKRMCVTVNRVLYEAFYGKPTERVRISSLLDHEYEIKNGFSDKPIFDLKDVTLTSMTGKRKTKEYSETHIRKKQEVIDLKNKLDKNKYAQAYEVLEWVLGKEGTVYDRY